MTAYLIGRGGRGVVPDRVGGKDSIGDLCANRTFRNHTHPDGIAGHTCHKDRIVFCLSLFCQIGDTQFGLLQRNQRAGGSLGHYGMRPHPIHSAVNIRRYNLHQRRFDFRCGGQQFKIVNHPAPGEIASDLGAFLQFELELDLSQSHFRTDVEYLGLPPVLFRFGQQVVLLPNRITAVAESAAPAVCFAGTEITGGGNCGPLRPRIVLLVHQSDRVRIRHLADVGETENDVTVLGEIIHG